MDSLLLHNFKAFKDNFTLNPNGDNVLIYGENGSGKSSLFEGIKLFYFSTSVPFKRDDIYLIYL